MGTLRLLLALSVVVGHSLGNLLVGGRNAVQLFYVISGFLISYVLLEAKTYPQLRQFYINRYLRLYPMYFVVALLTFGVLAIASASGKQVEVFEIYRSAPLAADLLLIFANVTLFLQDWLLFMGVDQGALVFTADFTRTEVELNRGLLVPQAWTLGVELSFYLVAPFILRSRALLIVLLASSVLLRLVLIDIGVGAHDPWTYRFFPTELALFLSGALAHQVLLPLYKRVLGPKRLAPSAIIGTGSLVLLTLAYSFIPVPEPSKSLALFGLFLVGLPLTFVFQSTQRWDIWIGNLSYPLYIGHVLVFYIVAFTWEGVDVSDQVLLMGKVVSVDRLIAGTANVVLSLAFAILLERFVARRVEALRARFRRPQVQGAYGNSIGGIG